jgi:hypothetical protein
LEPCSFAAGWRRVSCHSFFSKAWPNDSLRSIPGFNPVCNDIPDTANPAGTGEQTQAVNRRRAAYWDAAEKFFSVCQLGRTSVSNGVGQYNPNVFIEKAKSLTLNPDARYANLYNILYGHNSGHMSGYSKTSQPEFGDDKLNFATTYNPESFSAEVQFFMPTLQAASFPLCIRLGTSTPPSSVSASVVDNLNVNLPLRCHAALCGHVRKILIPYPAECSRRLPAQFFTMRLCVWRLMLCPLALRWSRQLRLVSLQCRAARFLNGHSIAD